MTKTNLPLSLLMLGLILIFGFYLRIKSVSETIVTNPISRDAKLYYMYAYNLKYKHTFSMETGDPANLNSPVSADSFCSPGYPFFLAFLIDGLPLQKNLNKIYFCQAFLSTLTLLFAFLIFKRFLPLFWSVAASALITLCPHLIIANSYILTETLFCFLLVLMGWATSIFIEKPSFRMATIIGITMGAANLVRPSLQYFPVVMALFLLLFLNRKKGFYFFLFIILGFLMVASPWFIRNMVSAGGESNRKLMINFLHHGMYPNFMFAGKTETYGFPYLFDPRSEEISKDVFSVLTEIAARFRQEPIEHLLWFLVKKPYIFWSWNLIQGRDAFVYSVSTSPYFYNKIFQQTHFLMYIFHGGVIFLSMAGSLLAWIPLIKNHLPEKSIQTARFFSLLLIYFTFIHMLGAPFPRYSIPLRPFFYGMAVFFLYGFIFIMKASGKTK